MIRPSAIHRALVTFSDPATGEIRVKVPQILGDKSEVSLSRITREQSGQQWVVPTVGSQILVAADDDNMTNLFWVKAG